MILAACSGSSKQSGPVVSTGMVLSGSVGDGPIVGAEIRVFDAEGALVRETVSDTFARYQIDIPDGISLPVTVTASGGTDLVTGRPADFELRALALASGQINLNVTPHTTMASIGASCRRSASGERLSDTLQHTWNGIDAALNFGWDRTLQNDPQNDEIDDSNIAMALLSNEALGELVRRTTAALPGTGAPLSADDVLEMLACDVADGRLDGAGPGADRRVSITALAASVSVQLEVLAGALHVDGQDAMALLDDALRTVLPDSAQSVMDAPILASQISGMRSAIAVLDGVLQQDALKALLLALGDASTQDIRSQARALLTEQTRGNLALVTEQIGLAPDQQINALAQRQVVTTTMTPPVLSFSAAATPVQPGDSTRLSWASADAEQCLASGGWTGPQPVDGVHQTAPLSAATVYRLTCIGPGGSATETLVVGVDGMTPGSPAPAGTLPTVSLNASDSSVTLGSTLQLSWTSTQASACSAAGGWSGGRNPSGTRMVGPLTATSTFQITCTGVGGSASDAVTVMVTEAPAPAEPTAPTSPSPSPQPSPAGEPQLSFTSAASTLTSGETTTLSWSSTNASSCTASGGWSGSRAVAGSQAVGPLGTSTTFSLSCAGAGGNVLQMLTVSVNGQITLNWKAPSQNVDGSALTDLAGYRIYYGAASRDYTETINIDSAAATSRTLTLPSGSYHVAMTAFDSEGHESAYSNEVIKTVP